MSAFGRKQSSHTLAIKSGSSIPKTALIFRAFLARAHHQHARLRACIREALFQSVLRGLVDGSDSVIDGPWAQWFMDEVEPQ